MGLREDIVEMKREVQSVKEQSLAMELLKDSKRANKRICFAFSSVLMLVIILWFLTGVYLIHVLNDIGTEEITTETYEVEQEADNYGNNNFIRGDNNEVK